MGGAEKEGGDGVSERPRWDGTVRRPPRHFGWIYARLAEVESRASTFLAAGLGRGERLMYVADDPHPQQWPTTLVDRRDLLVLSSSEAYGPDRIVDADAQRSRFESALAEALADGYAGMRVFADNTSFVDGPERLAAWMRWEEEAERFMAGRPFTGMCAFDGTRIGAEALEVVTAAHRQMASPVP